MPKFKFLARAFVALMMAHGMGKCSLAVAQVSEIKGSVITSHDAPKNFIRNGEFEQNELGVTDASGIVTRTTSAPLSGKASSAINATGSGQLARYEILAFGDSYPKGSNCRVSFVYTGDASLYKAYVRESGVALSLEKTLSNVGTSTFPETFNYVCGSGSNAQELVIESTGDGAAIKIDSIFAGAATNVGTVAQAHQLGAVYYGATASCAWSRTGVGSDSFGSFSADSDCPTASSSGYAAAPGTKIPGITFSSIPAGRLICTATGAFVRSGTASSASRFRLTDGTSTSASQSVFADATGISGAASPVVSGEFSYATSQSNVTIQVQGLTTSTSNAVTIDASATDFFISCQHFPEGSSVVANTIDPTLTDSRNYTPTGSWTANTTYSGVWWRVADKLYSRFRVATTGAPTSASLTVNYIPSGLSVDTTKLPSTATNGSVYMGTCKVFDSGTFYMHASLYYNGSNVAVVGFASSSASNHPDQNFNDTFPMTWANGDSVECVTEGIPILGWTSPATVVPLYKGGVVSRDNTAGVTTISSVTTVTSSSTLTDRYDTVIGNPSGGSFTSGLPPAAEMKGRAYNLIRANYTGTNTWTIDPNSTELICGQSTYVVARTLSIVSDGTNWHGIGPECNLPVIVQATSTASTVYNNGPTTFTVASENIDSHNAWASNTLTAPRAGAYMLCGTATVTGIIAASNQWIRLLVRNITGGTTTVVGAVTSGDVATVNSQTWTVSGCHVMQMTLGGTADFQIQTNTAGSQTQVSTGGLNNIFIVYLGPSTGVQ